MNNTLVNNLSGSKTDGALARLGFHHGYRFNADSVLVNATFNILDDAAHNRSWALQVWSGTENSVNLSNRHVISGMALPPIGEVADFSESFEVDLPAQLPAGQGSHALALALVSGQNGQFNEVHDVSVYPNRETFCLPRIAGNAGYEIQDGDVILSVERIENPRNAGNLSGTLALELWALPSRYQGGAFAGQPLAGVAFDSLAGQCEYRNLSFRLPFAAPAAGEWNLVLMLREWTAAGYVTRDYVNFDQRFVQSAPVNTAPAAKVKALGDKAVSPMAKVAKKVKAVAAKLTGTVRPAKASAGKNVVSVNTATAAELAEVKGLSDKIAKAIIKERPFRTLDELTRVKGLGEKTLAKLRSSLKL